MGRRKFMKLKRLAPVLVVAGLALAFYGFSGGVAAATTGNAVVTFTILSHQTLTIAGATVAFGNVTPDIATSPATVAVTVKSNVAYNLTYTAPVSFTETPSGTKVVPIGRLTYGGTAFLSGTNPLETAHARTTGTGVIHSYNYVLTVLFDDDTGSYTGTITYTVSP
jgi:hypothetical protein